jgi:hypothetical protein
MKYIQLKRFVFSTINEWNQFGHKFNWYTFTFILVEFENEVMTGGYEFAFIFLGLGFRIRYNRECSDEIFAKWEKDVEEMNKK